jgi:hypothetical protein
VYCWLGGLHHRRAAGNPSKRLQTATSLPLLPIGEAGCTIVQWWPADCYASTHRWHHRLHCAHVALLCACLQCALLTHTNHASIWMVLEVILLQNIPRTRSCTTNRHCHRRPHRVTNALAGGTAIKSAPRNRIIQKYKCIKNLYIYTRYPACCAYELGTFCLRGHSSSNRCPSHHGLLGAFWPLVHLICIKIYIHWFRSNRDDHQGPCVRVDWCHGLVGNGNYRPIERLSQSERLRCRVVR